MKKIQKFKKAKPLREIIKGKCKFCGKEFIKKTSFQIFCSSKCRLNSWILKRAEEIGKKNEK